MDKIGLQYYFKTKKTKQKNTFKDEYDNFHFLLYGGTRCPEKVFQCGSKNSGLKKFFLLF